MDRRLSTLFVFAGVVLLVGCEKKVKILPERAAPGETVSIRHTSAKFQNKDDITVSIGNRRAGVTDIRDPSTIEVLVPALAPGKVEVRVQSGNFKGKGTVNIRRQAKQRVFLTYDAGKISLQMVMPYTGQYGDMPSTGRRLSYDVFDSQRRLVYTNAIRHPAEWQVEAFPEGGRIERVHDDGPLTFGIKIPYVEGGARIEFFDAPDAIDLKSIEARQRRIPIGEVRIDDQ